MHIKSIVAGAAIALAATVGSAYAADQFATLDGVSAESLSSAEMAAVAGAVVNLRVTPPDPGFTFAEVVAVIPTNAPSAGITAADNGSGGVVSQ